MAGVAAIWAVYGVGAVSFWMFEIITTGSSSVSQTTPKQWAIAASAAIPAMIGTGMFLLGLHHGAKVATATAISSVYPALTAVLAWYFLSESLSVRELAGIAMIIGGVLLFQ